LIEVQSVDLVPCLLQRLHGMGEQRAIVAGFNRVRVDDMNAHQAASTVFSPSKSQARPELRSKSGFSQATILPGLRIPDGSASFLKSSCAWSVFFIPPSSSV